MERRFRSGLARAGGVALRGASSEGVDDLSGRRRRGCSLSRNLLGCAFFCAFIAVFSAGCSDDNGPAYPIDPDDRLHFVPLEYETIQAAVDGASLGDTVLVIEGVYRGVGNRDIRVGNTNLVVRSVSGPELTVIDCEGGPEAEHRGFIFDPSFRYALVIEGFTIRNGYVATGTGFEVVGGGIAGGRDAILAVANCRIENNRADIGGGIYGGETTTIRNCVIEGNSSGVSCSGNSSKIIDCEISRNDGTGIRCLGMSASVTGCSILENAGAGVFTRATEATVADCIIAGNRGRGVNRRDAGHVTVVDCLITGNAGGFHGVEEGPTRFVRCTIAGNRAGRGGGIYCASAFVVLDHTIIWGNCSSEGGRDVWFGDEHAGIRLHCCAFDPAGVEGDGGVETVGEQVSSDPRFAGPAACADAPTTAGSYSLQADSPCLPGASPCGERIGAYGAAETAP
jgi:hypothetical protein